MSTDPTETSALAAGTPPAEDQYPEGVVTPGKVRVTVVTPERAVLDEMADFVVLPMLDGELGVLPKHAPMVGRLGPGEMRITKGERTDHYFLEGGFAQVRGDVVTVLASNVRPIDVLTVVAAEQALRDAEGLPWGSTAQQAAKRRALEVAHAMLRIAQKYASAGP